MCSPATPVFHLAQTTSRKAMAQDELIWGELLRPRSANVAARKNFPGAFLVEFVEHSWSWNGFCDRPPRSRYRPVDRVISQWRRYLVFSFPAVRKTERSNRPESISPPYLDKFVFLQTCFVNSLALLGVYAEFCCRKVSHPQKLSAIS